MLQNMCGLRCPLSALKLFMYMNDFKALEWSSAHFTILTKDSEVYYFKGI